jgi:hypothetical protein
MSASFSICYECYMTRRTRIAIPDLLADPFGERLHAAAARRLSVLGARFLFESDSPELLHLVDRAYAGLPRHRLSDHTPSLRVGLLLSPADEPRRRRRGEPPPPRMLSGVGYLGGATGSSDFVMVSPEARKALVVVSRAMLEYSYHARYEFIEFAVFTLAARSQGLVSLHGACIGQAGQGILLMGPTGSGKSTVTLQCLLNGFEILSEDSVFAAPGDMLATGVANFLHVQSDSLRWLERDRDVAAIRKSPVIRRRSGIEKFEVDLRQGNYRLAPKPLKIAAIVFLSAQRAARGPLLKPLPPGELPARLALHQAYAANLPGWAVFRKAASRIPAYELRRGRHPVDAVEPLQALLPGSHAPRPLRRPR